LRQITGDDRHTSRNYTQAFAYETQLRKLCALVTELHFQAITSELS